MQINQLALTLERHKKDQPALAASQKTEADLKDQLAALGKPAQPIPSKTNEAKTLDPEARKRAMVAVGRNWLEQPSAPIYAHLARSLGLSDLQLEQLRNLNAERHAAALDAMQRTPGQTADTHVVVTQAMVQAETQMRQLLGDAGFAQYLQQIPLAPAESAVHQMNQTLAVSAQPLSDTQQDQLARLLADNQPKSANGAVALWSSLNLVNVDQNVAVSDATLTQAANFLSPDQMQALSQYRSVAEAKAAVVKGVQTQFVALTKAAAAAQPTPAP